MKMKKVSTYKELFSKEVCCKLANVCKLYKGFITKVFKIMEVGSYIHWEFELKTIQKKQTMVFPMVMEKKYCEKALEELKSGGDCLMFEDEEREFKAFFENPKKYYITYDILPRFLEKEVIEKIAEISLNCEYGKVIKIEMYSKSPVRLLVIYEKNDTIIELENISALKKDFETLRICYYSEEN